MSPCWLHITDMFIGFGLENGVYRGDTRMLLLLGLLQMYWSNGTVESEAT